jgi:long-chain acyl-CoA synthetase
VKRFLIQTALNSKGKEVERGISRRDSLWDYLVFRKVQNALGGKVRLVISGGAPVNAETLKFFRCALGCMVIEGYGQTETTGVLTMTLPMETTGGHVGPPLRCAAIKLMDVPEMNYFSKNDQGELCAKGPMVFKGYYKNPEETEKALDEDGWLHTGDIAMWLPSGALKIIDRKKNIFKLSQGEYIAPEKIEIIYSRCSLVAQTFVYGDSFKSFLVGIVVPDPETLKKHYPDADIRALCADRNVKALVLDEMNKVGRENGLKSFEQVKKIYLHPDPFTLEQGLLTPTMKSKRPELKTFFETQIKEMYNPS